MSRKLVIYRIWHTATGRSYIGQTRCGANVRWSQHRSRLRAGKRDHKLYEAMRLDGIDAFQFEVLCHALRAEDLNDLEHDFIVEFDAFANGYNMTDGGFAYSDETRAKQSLAHSRPAPWARDNWARRRANGTDKIDMRKYVPAGKANPNSKSYVVRTPSGGLKMITGMKAFCTAAGLTAKGLYDTLNGKQTHHKGYALLTSIEATHVENSEELFNNNRGLISRNTDGLLAGV